MATAPTLVVAGHPGVAEKLRDTGRFPVVFDVTSASELRDLSKSGKVGSPVAFVFAPGFTEDVPGAEVAVLANGLVRNGYTVLVHVFFTERGDVFDPKVVMAAKQMNMAELLVTLGVVEPEPEPELQPEPPAEPWTPPGPPAGPHPGPQAWPQPSMGDSAVPRPTPVSPRPAPPSPPLPPGGPPPAPPSPRSVPVSHRSVPVSSTGRRVWPETPPANTGAAAPAAPYAPAGGPVRRGGIIAITSAKGGVGKTSTTVNLAVHAARLLRDAGRAGSAVVVDANFRRADMAQYLSLGAPTILDLLQAPWTSSAQAVRENLANIPEVGLYALLAPSDALSVDLSVINGLYRRILTVLRQTFDFVFIDTPVAEPRHGTFVDPTLPEADAILVPVEPDRVTLEAVRSWLAAITEPGHQEGGEISPEKIFMIVNRARPDVECGPEEVMNQLGGWRFAGLIPEDEGWMRAVNTRRLTSVRMGSELERTLQEILGAVSDDPVFAVPEGGLSGMSRWKKLLPLKPR
ncbi:AAA family ATPase [Actinoallomurus acaciae]|uniref:CpaE family protein n=1 Tax=Actinoallomurus acaciae TaxID=502577 RepID=A0ABV5Y9S4_9ACTN